jgi:hypothetical protein
MKRFHPSQMGLLAFTMLAFGVASPTGASADSYTTYDVNATYDNGLGSLTGSFTLDSTTNTSYAVDLITVGAGGVNSGTYTDPTQFGTSTYVIGGGVIDATYSTDDPGLQIFLNYEADGTLFTGDFGNSSIDSYFSSTCGGEICRYTLYGTVTPAVTATPLPGSVALFGSVMAALAGFGFMRQRKNVQTGLIAA